MRKNSLMNSFIINCFVCRSQPKLLQQENTLSSIVDFVREYNVASKFGLEDFVGPRTCELVQEETIHISKFYALHEILFWFFNQSKRRQRGIGPAFVTELRLLSQFDNSAREEELMASVRVDMKHLPLSSDREVKVLRLQYIDYK